MDIKEKTSEKMPKPITEAFTKILMINFGGLGDQILFFPTIKSIKLAYPNSEIVFATEPRSASAEKLTEFIDKTFVCDIKTPHKHKNLLNIAKFLVRVWREKFDIVISSGSSPQVAVLLFLTGIKNRIGFECGAISRFLLSKKGGLNLRQYAANMYHELAKALIPGSIFTLPEIKVPEESVNKIKHLLNIDAKSDKKIIVIHPGVSKLSILKNILKFWDVKNWAELIKRLLETDKYIVVMAGGNDDTEAYLAIKEKLKIIGNKTLSENLLDFMNKTSNVMELAALIKLSDALVCVDSAPMHIGVGVGVKTIALFGPTDEKKLLPEKDSRFLVLKSKNLVCRPCLWDRRKVSCENPVCLDIPVEEVFESLEKLINN